ncbi:hypothetical protein TRVL_04730 [Trypanosoma vivax]|nr:hypothetical protein TRVL_04730 [Trypanosoma vivax]
MQAVLVRCPDVQLAVLCHKNMNIHEQKRVNGTKRAGTATPGHQPFLARYSFMRYRVDVRWEMFCTFAVCGSRRTCGVSTRGTSFAFRALPVRCESAHPGTLLFEWSNCTDMKDRNRA